MPILEERTISGKGIVQVPVTLQAYKQAKVITVYTTVIRPATSQYLNYAYNPPRSRYCTLNFIRDGHVVRTESMEYESQSWDFYPEISAQTLYAVECMYAGILQTFVNLGNALDLIPISVTNNIEDWNHTDLFFDDIKVVCYADTAVRVTVSSLTYDLCPDQEEKQPNQPPPPPDEPDRVEPGTPLYEGDNAISPPYQGENDDGDTVPHPIDQPPPPPPEFPQGVTCVAYLVSVTASRVTGGTQTSSSPVFGEIQNIYISPSGTAISIDCRGLYLGTSSVCQGNIVTVNTASDAGGYVPGSLTYTITPL